MNLLTRLRNLIAAKPVESPRPRVVSLEDVADEGPRWVSEGFRGSGKPLSAGSARPRPRDTKVVPTDEELEAARSAYRKGIR